MLDIREDFGRALRLALSETLENLAFMEVVPSPNSIWTTAADQTLCVGLRILEPVQGELRLWAPSALIRKVAAILFIRPEDEIDQALQLDIAAELINTLAGRFLSRLLCPSQSFQLGLPESHPGAGTPPEGAAACWHFSAEQLPLFLGAAGDSLLELIGQQPIAAG
ncbi:MAG: chemotaxis protein CheX [Trichloromonadaceae bacterium]